MQRTLIAIAIALAATFAAAPAAHASTGAILEDEPGVSSQSDGTSSGVILEDDPRWSCVDDGNRVCGPTNTEGKPAGCYDDGGVMVAPWPCEAWKPSDGYAHH